jgi:hypothetical protein
VAREFPIDLALGMPCAIDLLTMEGDENRLDRKLRDLYRLYNLGFRPALGASTDFHVEQGRQPIGSVRTYVRSGSLELKAIAAAYRTGRTFVTNGPLLDLRVNDGMPGDEVTLTRTDGPVRVSVEGVSIGQLDRAEILVNGQVFRSFPASEPHRISGACEVPVEKSMWIAAKVIGPEDPHLASALEGRPLGAGQIAHTSPVYVIVDAQPILAAQAADADYFVEWCEAVMVAWRAHLSGSAADAQHDALVSDRIARAASEFLRIRSLLE